MPSKYVSTPFLDRRYALPFFVIGLPLFVFGLYLDLIYENIIEVAARLVTLISIPVMRPIFEHWKQGRQKHWLWAFAGLLMVLGIVALVLMNSAFGLLTAAVLICIAMLLMPINLRRTGLRP